MNKQPKPHTRAERKKAFGVFQMFERISSLAWCAAQEDVDPHFMLGKISEIAEEGMNVVDEMLDSSKKK